MPSDISLKIKLKIAMWYRDSKLHRRANTDMECMHLLPKALCGMCEGHEFVQYLADELKPFTTDDGAKPKPIERARRAEQPRERRPRFPNTKSKWDSRCSGCGEQIYEGDEIYKVDEYWVCRTCAESA